MTYVEESMKISFSQNIIFTIISALFFPITLIGKLILILYDVIVPPSLRELVPLLNMWRKLIQSLTIILADPVSKECVELQNSIDKMQRKEERLNEAYPLQRGIGETFDRFTVFILVIVVPIFIWNRSIIEIINIHPLLLALLFSATTLFLTWVMLAFGPIYVIFHRSSLKMVERGAYGWAWFYQLLENLFGLPYYSSRISFSFYDAPPISEETYEIFKNDLLEDVKDIKDRLQKLISISGSSLSKEAFELYEESFEHRTMKEYDMNQATDNIARAFALLLWKKEEMMLPMHKQPSLEKFVDYYQMQYNEAKKFFEIIVEKYKSGYITKNFFNSLLISGSLKGMWKILEDDKYKDILNELEFNQLSFVLALGSQKYILDMFEKKSILEKIKQFFMNLLYGLTIPIIEIIKAIVAYLIHIKNQILALFSRGFIKRGFIYTKNRYKEIKANLILRTQSQDELIKAEKEKEKKQILMGLLGILKLILKIILIIPLSLFYIAKTIFNLISYLLTRNKNEEEIRKTNLEKILAKETMFSIYVELYDKLILQTLETFSKSQLTDDIN